MPEVAKDLAMAWLQVNRALNPAATEEWAEEYFDDAAIYAQRVLDADTPDFRQRLEAIQLMAYMPAFRTRRNGQPSLDPDDWQHIQTSVATSVEDANDAVIHAGRKICAASEGEHEACFTNEAQREGVLALLTGQLLVARAGFTPYISSTYERLGPRGNVRSAAHDFYLVLDSGDKLPIKATPDSNPDARYRQEVVRLSLSSIARSAANTIKNRRDPSHYELADFSTAEMSELVADEALGVELDQKEELFVDTLTAEVKRTVDRGIGHHYSPSPYRKT